MAPIRTIDTLWMGGELQRRFGASAFCEFLYTKSQPTPAMPLTKFTVHCEHTDPELSRRAWQLAANRLIKKTLPFITR